ncbi:MAG: RagB/SusD family nutrient uptake outer membrane protein [Cytophagales bacterium]|nr:RagB/SusD family nutrient uptake outer membrane protein [Cytophagales bacterium]
MKTLFIYIITACLFLVSCNELELENPNSLNQGNFYRTEDDAILAVNAAYSALQKRGGPGGVFTWYANILRSGESVRTANTPAPVAALGDFSGGLSGSTNLLFIYRHVYDGVYRCNAVLTFVAAMDNLNEDLKTRMMGEAYFLRGLYHFHLTTMFGDVPYVDRLAEDDEDFQIPATPRTEMLQRIAGDLQAAKDRLPSVTEYRGTDELGRASRGAATALLGKVYLYAGQYQQAADQFREVYESSEYMLNADYRENFIEVGDNNMESIFEVQFENTPGRPWGQDGDNPQASEGNIFTRFTGASGSDTNPIPYWYNMQPSEQTVNEYEADDPRKNATLFYPGGTATILTTEGVELNYDSLSIEDYAWRKFIPEQAYTGDPLNSPINMDIMRYADVLLMYAEALNEISGPSAALPLINEVRTRVNMPGYPTAGFPASSPDDVFRIIVHERRVELACEAIFWNDLVRWDNAGKLDMTTYVNNPSFNINFHKVLPIPEPELSTNLAMEPNENPG